MSDDLIRDLNEYFSKQYTNFDRISSMPSYESVTISMVLRNRNRIEEGDYASNEMRKIVYQPQAEKVLAELKERYVDDIPFDIEYTDSANLYKGDYQVTSAGQYGAADG